MSRPLAPGSYGAADLVEGDWIDCGCAVITSDEIEAFAELTGDRFEIHMSDAGARAHGFPRRVAHGLLVLSRIDGMKNLAAAQIAARASLRWDWHFRRPVFAGDEIAVRLTIAGITPLSREGQVELRIVFDVTNQAGEVVQNGENRLRAYL